MKGWVFLAGKILSQLEEGFLVLLEAGWRRDHQRGYSEEWLQVSLS